MANPLPLPRKRRPIIRRARREVTRRTAAAAAFAPFPQAMPPGYRPAPLGPTAPAMPGDIASAVWVRASVDVINRTLSGKLNATLPITLEMGAVETFIGDPRISAFSAILLTPRSLHAAAIHPSIYVAMQTSGAAVLSHDIVTAPDCIFMGLIVG